MNLISEPVFSRDDFDGAIEWPSTMVNDVITWKNCVEDNVRTSNSKPYRRKVLSGPTVVTIIILNYVVMRVKKYFFLQIYNT